ncbi:CsbD-like protein [mine drainage metagenome]|uniref:CsbD-like protein n=1 Tax=mine drainage metagenome TaxID=410659 RepID=A0A1J5S7X2_9ZZZZ
MNKNQIKGAAKDVAGKVQEEAGKLVGSKEQQVKGLNKQIAGKAEKSFGDVKEAVKRI